jgi:hypothetical protein
VTDTHNKKAYDRTLWYTFKDPAKQREAGEDLVWFNVEIAKHYGVESALILTNLKYWITENQKKDPNYVWHRVSCRKIAEHLPIPKRTINRIFQNLSEGDSKVLERRRGEGFDKAKYYRINGNWPIDPPNSIMHAPNPENDGPKSIMHAPNSNIHAPNSQMHAPNPYTYTTIKDTQLKTPIEERELKTHIQTEPASPGVCVCPSHSLFSTAQNEVTSPLPAPSIFASGQDSGRKDSPDADSMISSSGSSSPAIVPSSDPDQSAIDSVSSLEDQLNDVSLSLEEKARLFMTDVKHLNTQGYNIVYTSRSVEKARHFFELNPNKSAKSLIDVLDYCAVYKSLLLPFNDGEYDEAFHLRRSNNLGFFFKYLPILSGLDQDSSLGDAVLDDDGPRINLD